MRLSNEDYVARITTATALQLVIITYELAIDNISDAIEHHGSEPSDKRAYKESISRAREFLASLIDSLDLSLEIGRGLMLVYIRINKLLIDAELRNDVSLLETAKKMLTTILEGWHEVEKDDNTQPVMSNTQQVYAGLTYNRGGLNEYIPEDRERGYKA